MGRNDESTNRPGNQPAQRLLMLSVRDSESKLISEENKGHWVLVSNEKSPGHRPQKGAKGQVKQTSWLRETGRVKDRRDNSVSLA